MSWRVNSVSIEFFLCCWKSHYENNCAASHWKMRAFRIVFKKLDSVIFHSKIRINDWIFGQRLFYMITNEELLIKHFILPKLTCYTQHDHRTETPKNLCIWPCNLSSRFLVLFITFCEHSPLPWGLYRTFGIFSLLIILSLPLSMYAIYDQS